MLLIAPAGANQSHSCSNPEGSNGDTAYSGFFTCESGTLDHYWRCRWSDRSSRNCWDTGRDWSEGSADGGHWSSGCYRRYRITWTLRDPAGPMGATGATGAKGATGPQGLGGQQRRYRGLGKQRD